MFPNDQVPLRQFAGGQISGKGQRAVCVDRSPSRLIGEVPRFSKVQSSRLLPRVTVSSSWRPCCPKRRPRSRIRLPRESLLKSRQPNQKIWFHQALSNLPISRGQLGICNLRLLIQSVTPIAIFNSSLLPLVPHMPESGTPSLMQIVAMEIGLLQSGKSRAKALRSR